MDITTHAHLRALSLPAFALAPITPAVYVAMRRKAARLSIDQAAERIAPRERDRIAARAMIRLLETRGVVARNRATIVQVARGVPLDPAVYFRLATQPPAQHPRICRGCGCSAYDPCHLGDDQLCRILPGDPAICTRCTDGEWY